MIDASLESKLERIVDCAEQARRDDIFRSLLHGYTACLSIDELCEAAVSTLDGSMEVHGAVRNRLLRLGRESRIGSKLDGLARRVLTCIPSEAKKRVRAEALLSHIYIFLSPPTRQAVLDRWQDAGTLAAGVRWLKAIENDELFFDAQLVLAYWLTHRDWRAARLLANRAEPALLTEILPKLVQHCEEGWVIGKAALRASSISEETWKRIRAKLPATYAYLCAKTGRAVDATEALELIEDSDELSGDRGLAIWAVGQMGHWSVLEKVRSAALKPRARAPVSRA